MEGAYLKLEKLNIEKEKFDSHINKLNNEIEEFENYAIEVSFKLKVRNFINSYFFTIYLF